MLKKSLGEIISQDKLEQIKTKSSLQEFEKFVESLNVILDTQNYVDKFNEKHNQVDDKSDIMNYAYIKGNKVFFVEILNYSQPKDQIKQKFDITSDEYKIAYDYCQKIMNKYLESTEENSLN